MRLQLNGVHCVYDVQMFCMLYFPGTSFHNIPDGENEPVCMVHVHPSVQAVQTEVILVANGKKGCGVCEEPIHCGDVVRAEKRSIGKAFFSAGEQLFGYRPPFGILTGVRPAKLAIAALSDGKTPQQTQEYLQHEYFVSAEKASLITAVAENEQHIIDSMKKDSCSLYVSIPFCPTRCAYCSFVSYATKHLLAQIPAYLTRLCADIRATAALIRTLGLTVSTIYIGGGTPTTLHENELEQLLSQLSASFDIAALSEFTLEAGRPDTVTAEKLSAAARHGVTRISINPQTLNNSILEKIGRNHTAETFFRAYELGVKSGIPHINSDLIAGLPDESYESFCDSFDRVRALQPDNITVHTFSVKKASELRHGERDAFSASGGDIAGMVRYARQECEKSGWLPYYLYRQKNTVSNLENVGYAKPGAEGLYNVYMMEELHPVFACGAGAVTRLVNRERTDIKRIFSAKYPYEYLRPDGKTTISDTSRKEILAFFSENA